MKMASTTKLMTTLITLENSSADNSQITFRDDMIAEGSSMYLKVGDKLRLYDLAVGMMMCSGNDAANAAALTIGGSTEKFAEMMNKRAKAIGMTNTNFVTPSGLDDDNHYSTAYDMALLMAYALDNSDFREITKSKSMTVDFIEPKVQRTYQNHNRLLSLYDYCIGGKTGYTMAAGRCLVSAACKDSVTLVCVTLNDHNDWDDHIALYDYGFSRYCGVDTDDSDESFTLSVAGGDKDEIPLYCDFSQNTVIEKEKKDSVQRRVYIPEFEYAPIKKGECVGMVVYTSSGEIIAQNPLYAKENVSRIQKGGFIEYIKNIFG